ncbi:lipoprotein [Listeria marthii]|uniref:lipoprotein n=1 Tax=Listeria marthii TaxID=529731 RepID=UPI00162759EE|nr:lipoprotein [Listeria marthii]MBC1969721.1 lipoprotein [Listeria marthii]MBC2085281.1 lipoprotein [Listeria marthii]MBF2393706.1 lipoprotein [Listeria marthii]MBF2588865.1 lipoprotein [Listeria marthii]
MKKLIVIISALFLLSGCAAKEEDATFGLEKVPENFSYGEVFKVTKKDSEQATLRMSNDQLFLDCVRRVKECVISLFIG